MKRNVLLVLSLFISFLTASSQSKYCRLYQKNRPVNFYWDVHDNNDHQLPNGVSKETVYHQKINSKDSILEQVIWYNRQGLPVITEVYAAPTNENLLVFIDSFFYDSNNLPIQINHRWSGCSGIERWSHDLFQYDSLHRETSYIKIAWGSGDEKQSESVYENNKMSRAWCSWNDLVDMTEIYFYSNGRKDSMQVLDWGSNWRYTIEYLYDTLQLKKESYIRNKTGKYLKTRVQYNADGTVRSELINYRLNWNKTRELTVETHMTYNRDRSVRECLFFVKGKKAFVKKHYYEYY